MPEPERQIRGRHVLAMILGFFGVIVLVNGVFVTLALDTFGGSSTDLAYLKGLRYNETLAAAEAQKQLGWQVAVDHQTTAEGRLAINATYRDRYDQAVPNLRVIAELYRPTHDDVDQSSELAAAGHGQFTGEIPLPLRGQWQLRLTAERNDEPVHHLERRLWLK